VRDTGGRGQDCVGVVVIEGRRLGGRHIPPSYQNLGLLVLILVVVFSVRGVSSFNGIVTSFRVVVVILNPLLLCCRCCSPSTDRKRRHFSLLDFSSPANVLRPV